MNDPTDEHNEITERIQQECHKFCDEMMDYMHKRRKSKIQVQDIVNIFFYKKLADIELRLRSLEAKTTISHN